MGGPKLYPDVMEWLQNRPSGTFNTNTVANACRLAPEQAYSVLRNAVDRCEPLLPGRLESLPKTRRSGPTVWRLDRDQAPLPPINPRHYARWLAQQPEPELEPEAEPESEPVQLVKLEAVVTEPEPPTSWREWVRQQQPMEPVIEVYPLRQGDESEAEPEPVVDMVKPSVSNPYIRPVETPAADTSARETPADCEHAHVQWLVILLVFIVEAVAVAAAVHWGGW